MQPLEPTEPPDPLDRLRRGLPPALDLGAPPGDIDQLDRLLRGGPRVPLAERARAALAERWPWAVAALVIVGVVVAVVLIRPGATPHEVTLAPSGAEPAGGTIAPTGSTAAGSTAGSVATTSAPSSTVAASIVVHVAGAVQAPGLVTLPPGARVADAVAAAGGLRSDADGDRLNLAAPLVDGLRVFVPVVGQVEPVVASPPVDATPGSSAPAGPVDINRASVAELESLPGVGPTTAAAIVAYRDEHGSFRLVAELQEVRGIGPSKFEALQGAVTVGP